ncbi:hypothetical protein A2422_01495 [Candidatus Woesebacteria bacterium RIFOXYC1_FULL_31_51]|uniref:Uncharacterized protein n=1 Tax=Candidatus Woesebacteria bacterium GW2011_GWC2_31_9 TaxID=1618586 RepID=A0A0F9YH90_9BACT|nr:MAG: hypothetical protein UR17_C0001G0751 [Candidatus Woesebacteria bacterium GW2011_GWF1_31_35]KKP22646.1 MAG: hypothetical protein UR11_C0002G0026 [Candidatus Woesebacteria bacterium GW2011_GWC1_30_29]KKP26922.1 MAG: hypothetical protein UR13_C0001G0017 [Candidatus Woesebacteria bacterium GW2011_GWD1_31_12]KKP27241.1 MAG: hypothetical protein UR16_C0005G0028 [Candidatus Woesebacteria bacterium GW2011_GWB1_31_29]KKP30959.1 MAG: hypothetical protein UR21_C0019G0005 [Candidatus Woesebacteria 
MNKEKIITKTNIILGVIVISSLVGILFSTKTFIGFNKKVATLKEANKPVNVKITKITDSSCSNCFNIDNAISTFKKLNVKVEEENSFEFNSNEGKELIDKFQIKKIPTYIVTGDVSNKKLNNFIDVNGEIKDDNFIFTKVLPVYKDTTSNLEMGNVTATLITDPDCTKCTNLKPIIEEFKKANVKIKELKEIAWNTTEGQKIIRQYKITKIPSFIFSSDFDLYDNAKSTWSNFGSVEKDKTYITRNTPLPYRDLNKGRILGLVDIIYLTDSTCQECYDPEAVQKPIVTSGYGVYLNSETKIDISSLRGKDLIKKYKITKIPTIILSPEVDQYVNLKNVWKSVGKIEFDGWYVFTELNQLNNLTYKDLSTNTIVRPVQEQK